MSENILEINNLSKYFGGLAAVSNCSLKIKKGTIHGLLGPNGAGKSTFINILGGLVRKNLGRIYVCGLDIDKNAIKVNNSLDYQTNKNGIYAIGDINTYPGKLKLILSGFHEAAIMCHSAYQIVNPGKKNILKYTTVSGISGFDGSKKEPKKTEINSFK